MNIPDIDLLCKDKEKFIEFVYTPATEATSILNENRKDANLKSQIDSFLNGDIPEPLKSDPVAVFFGQATPNYEIRRLLSLADGASDLSVVFLEYLDDKFVTENAWKFSMAKLKFFNGKGKNGGSKIESINIVDFNKSNGKKLSEIKTFWDEPLIDFHHDFLNKTYRKIDGSYLFNISNWLKEHGEIPKEYYKSILSLFIQNGILFENYFLDFKEIDFTKNVFLPAFIDVIKRFGKKPLIVALEPTEMEGDEFWTCYPYSSIDFVKSKLNI